MSETQIPKTGLALSGGGFRATLFHLGSVWRLNELGILQDITAISAVSGGSILAGLLGIRWENLNFRNQVAENFIEQIAQPTLKFCGESIDVKTILSGPFTGTRSLENFYEKQVVGKTTLQNLPDSPEFIFSAYHLETGRNWTFSKKRTHTWKIGDIEHPHTTMKKVLAASSAFPPAFPPVRLRLNPDSFKRSEYADHFQNRKLRSKVTLGDGGVYDNLGFHPIREMENILVSNGSSPLSVESMPRWRFWRNRATRPISAAIEQTRALRIITLMEDLNNKRKNGALWMINTNTKNYTATSPFQIEEGWNTTLSQIRTRLNKFTETEKKRLVNWGYIQADLAVRSHYSLTAEPPKDLPFPEFHFNERP